jgi:hypothetical protein
MPNRIAGVDVHKKMLAVVIADVAVEGAYQFTSSSSRLNRAVQHERTDFRP